MAHYEQFLEENVHPIDIVEYLAEHNDWNFSRLGDDRIAMTIAGLWREYSVVLSWSECRETLRLECKFKIATFRERLPRLYQLINVINDECWIGAFVHQEGSEYMAFRYGLVQAGGQTAAPEQVATIIGTAVECCERYYPAMQVALYCDRSPEEAIQLAIADVAGCA